MNASDAGPAKPTAARARSTSRSRILFQGAEAIITLQGSSVFKERIPKRYRHPAIDFRLRKTRTRKEAKVLASLPVPGPKLYSSDEARALIEMEYIDGKRLVDSLEKLDYKAICREIGATVRKLHDAGLVHGDLTTSNMILRDRVHLIDFGLSFNSEKDEDKAVDLHLLRQALESKHYSIWEASFAEVLKGYGESPALERLKTVEARGRNKSAY